MGAITLINGKYITYPELQNCGNVSEMSRNDVSEENLETERFDGDLSNKIEELEVSV